MGWSYKKEGDVQTVDGGGSDWGGGFENFLMKLVGKAGHNFIEGGSSATLGQG